MLVRGLLGITCQSQKPILDLFLPQFFEQYIYLCPCKGTVKSRSNIIYAPQVIFSIFASLSYTACSINNQYVKGRQKMWLVLFVVTLTLSAEAVEYTDCISADG